MVPAPPLSQEPCPFFPGLDSSGSKRKTPSSGTDAISMNNILRNLAKKKQYKSVVKHRYNMADVMRVVSQMEYFKDPSPPVYWWLLDHLAKDSMKLEIFVGLQNDVQRSYKEKLTKVDDEKRVKEAEAVEGRYLDVGFTLYRVRFEVCRHIDDLKEDAVANASMVSIQMLVTLMEAATNYLKIKNT
ncbi:hypothetical protein RHGRI_013450 [Rhododendron griersonianum]|uniref:Uncharacterized protein n=1 Tax=Rhododendron griersonianum TaxID=479676 RepID=A0AAV6K5L3_9ERIC|nr:hypothetical protein RHGRI_013450 [Rhododendron griersonianum]